VAAVVFGYQDHVASQVAESYAVTDDALSRSRAHVRQALVRQLLREDTASLPPSDLVTLDYDLAACHVVVLLPATPQGAAASLLVGLRAATGVRASLLHPLGLSSTAVWLGTAGAWSPALLTALREVLRRTGVEASLSGSASGLAGFRAALTQATEVERVRSAWGRATAPAVLEHADVRLEVLLLRDPAGARSFVEAELGPLAAGTAEAARLRDTLDASFQWGSHVAAAEHLQLHEHTVRNRLHKAEQQLGHPLQDRRTELQVALRLHRLLLAPDGGPQGD
jgi:sugar diacid utilization regulator